MKLSEIQKVLIRQNNSFIKRIQEKNLPSFIQNILLKKIRAFVAKKTKNARIKFKQ